MPNQQHEYAVCSRAVPGYSCLIYFDYYALSRSARGITVGALALSARKPLLAVKAEFAADQRRARQKAWRAAQRAAKRRRKEHERAVYCVQIKQGQHMGLSESEVRSYCGSPGKTQRMSTAGLTEDLWYYGGFLAGGSGSTTYQLAFENGYLNSANRY